MTDHGQTGFGEVLRNQREKLGLSLDDLAASTRVRKTYLQALEEENLQALPGKAYAVGFLRIYARQVGLPVDALLNSFNGIETDGNEESTAGTGASQSRHPQKRRRKGRGGRLFLLFAVLALIAATFFYLNVQRPGIHPVAETPPSPEVQGGADQPIPQLSAQSQPQAGVSPQPDVPVTTQGESAIVVTELPVLPPGGAIVRMLPVAAGVMKVSLDNQELREYQLQPEQSLNWKVTGTLACELSAPGLVRVWVDQQEVAVTEYPAFVLRTGAQQERQP